MLLICWLGEPTGGRLWPDKGSTDGIARVAMLRGAGAGGMESMGIESTAMADVDMSGGKDAAREAMARGDKRC